MDKCRESFEAKYRELHPNDKCTLMANGNYSGWIKQDHWWAWQSRQAEVDQLKCENKKIHGREIKKFEENLILKAEIEEKDKRIEELESAIKHLSGAIHKSISYEHDLFDKGWNECAERVVEDIYRLTGIGKGMRGEHE